MHLKANRNSDTGGEQAPPLPLEMGSYFLLMWPTKMRTHEFPSPGLRDDNQQACKSLAHTRAQLPKNSSGGADEQISPHPPWTNRKSLAWLKPKTETMEPARHDGWLRRLKTTICILPDKQLAGGKRGGGSPGVRLTFKTSRTLSWGASLGWETKA